MDGGELCAGGSRLRDGRESQLVNHYFVHTLPLLTLLEITTELAWTPVYNRAIADRTTSSLVLILVPQRRTITIMTISFAAS